MHTLAHVHTCTHTHTHTQVYVHPPPPTHTHTGICTHTHTHARVHTHTYAHTNTHTPTYEECTCCGKVFTKCVEFMTESHLFLYACVSFVVDCEHSPNRGFYNLNDWLRPGLSCLWCYMCYHSAAAVSFLDECSVCLGL